MTEALAETRNADERMSAIDEYLEIGAFLDGGLAQQTEFDCVAFEKAAGRKLNAEERAEFIRVQHQAMRWTFLGSGLTHPQVVATLERLTPQGAQKIADVAPAFADLNPTKSKERNHVG